MQVSTTLDMNLIANTSHVIMCRCHKPLLAPQHSLNGACHAESRTRRLQARGELPCNAEDKFSWKPNLFGTILASRFIMASVGLRYRGRPAFLLVVWMVSQHLPWTTAGLIQQRNISDSSPSATNISVDASIYLSYYTELASLSSFATHNSTHNYTGLEGTTLSTDMAVLTTTVFSTIILSPPYQMPTFSPAMETSENIFPASSSESTAFGPASALALICLASVDCIALIAQSSDMWLAPCTQTEVTLYQFPSSFVTDSTSYASCALLPMSTMTVVAPSSMPMQQTTAQPSTVYTKGPPVSVSVTSTRSRFRPTMAEACIPPRC